MEAERIRESWNSDVGFVRDVEKEVVPNSQSDDGKIVNFDVSLVCGAENTKSSEYSNRNKRYSDVEYVSSASDEEYFQGGGLCRTTKRSLNRRGRARLELEA